MPSKNTNCCDAQIQRHQVTTIQRIATKSRRSNASPFTFCTAHARMASEGFIEADGSVMNASDRSNYQSGRCKGNPYDFGKWSTQ